VEIPEIISDIIYNTTASYLLACVPMFVFMGEIILQSGISQRLYEGVSKWTGIIPGSLVHTNIVSCALFAAVSGTSVASAITIGSIAYPEQKARGYNRGLVTGSIAAGGTLGILIPPSITLIIYGAFVNASIGQLFLGGVIPGIILALSFMVYIGIRSLITPSIAEPRKPLTRGYFRDAILAFKYVWPILVIMVTIMGGIYGGIFTPTEAAAVAVVEALILTAMFGRLNFQMIKRASLGALRISAMAIFIMIGARIMASALAFLQIPAQLASTLGGMSDSPLLIWLGVIILYLILGCLMDGLSLMLLTLPVTYPLVVNTLGFDPIWFGVLVTLLVECALVTPPVGMIVYIIHNICEGTGLGEVFIGVMPFFICMLLIIALLTFYPNLVLFLPNQIL
jgi:tripartite ATP-independent transporter DctM subunit